MQRTILIILIVAIALFIIIGGLAGFMLKKGDNKAAGMMGEQKEETQSFDKKIFISQTASINGKITKVNNNTATVTSKTGISAEFELGQNLSINKIEPSTQRTINTNKKEDIETEKDTIIFLNYENGKYIIGTITYPPPMVSKEIPAPPLPKQSTNSAVPKVPSP